MKVEIFINKVEMFINKKGQPDWIVLVCLNLPLLVSVVSEEPEEIKEEVDKVKIKTQ